MQQQVLTDAERAEGTITKSRWMTLRDSISSTQTLGFRVDAVVTHAFHKTAFESELFMAREEPLVLQALFEFLPAPADCIGCTPRDLARAVLSRLEQLRQALTTSEVFPKNEFIGSSLFFAADCHGKVGLWMIDFNVTSSVDGGIRHDVPWELGNREDGYLTGLSNLERLWGLLIADESRWQ